jgi:hypothetical protein
VSVRCFSGIWQNEVYEHVICICNLAVLVTDDGESELGARDLIDVLDPSSVRLDGVGRQTDQLDATLGELRLKLCESAELGGANGSVILGVGEENDPVVADELVEVDWAGSGISLEVWCDGSEAETAELKLLGYGSRKRGKFINQYGISRFVKFSSCSQNE